MFLRNFASENRGLRTGGSEVQGRKNFTLFTLLSQAPGCGSHLMKPYKMQDNWSGFLFFKLPTSKCNMTQATYTLQCLPRLVEMGDAVMKKILKNRKLAVHQLGREFH